MATEEHNIQSRIQIALSKAGYKVFRTNVGTVETKDGRYFKTGLPKGFPDLMGFTPDNYIYFIEVKTPTGTASKAQKDFHKMLQKQNVIHGIARSPEDALKIVKGELVGYGFEDWS